MHDYLASILAISIFAVLGAVFLRKVLKKYKRFQKYALLTSMFLLIIIISQLMREGFAISMWAFVILIAGAVCWFLVKRFYKTQSIIFDLLPKLIGFAASYAIAADLGQAMAILFSLQCIPEGGLLGLQQRIRTIAEEQFKFIVLGVIAFVILLSLSSALKAYIAAFAAGMMLFVVIDEGFLRKR